jgi:hypothetical protein
MIYGSHFFFLPPGSTPHILLVLSTLQQRTKSAEHNFGVLASCTERKELSRGQSWHWRRQVQRRETEVGAPVFYN